MHETLTWRYRSRDERLIAVSNAHVYGHQLITAPAADTADALRHEVANPSRGVKGGANSPTAEVQRVVDLVLQHAGEHPGESLGVIALGLVHAHRVEAALDAALDEEPALRAVLDGHADEPMFVKNVERVQGDERDAVILSLGYGKGLDGRLPMLWGPLLKEGGHRRLNVAISRARRRMALVTSFEADDLAEDGHSSQGYQLMRHFVRFMASDGADIESPRGTAVPLNPFEQDIRRQLVAAGLDVVPQLEVAPSREPVFDTRNRLRWRVAGHCVPIDRSQWWLHQQTVAGLAGFAGASDRTEDDVALGALVFARRCLTRGEQPDTDLAAADRRERLTRLGALRPDGQLILAGALFFCPSART